MKHPISKAYLLQFKKKLHKAVWFFVVSHLSKTFSFLWKQSLREENGFWSVLLSMSDKKKRKKETPPDSQTDRFAHVNNINVSCTYYCKCPAL